MKDEPPFPAEMQPDALRIVEQLPAILWTTDTQLRITSSQGAALTRLGLKPNQVVGMTLYDYLQTTDPEFPAIKFSLRALQGESSHHEDPFEGGTYQSLIEPLRDAKGTIIGTLGIALDITDRKLAEQALQRAHDELETRVAERTAELSQTNEALRQSEQRYRRLLSELDHRVRNNLSALLGLVQVMRGATMSVDQFASAMEARLMAMAHVHRLLSEQAGKAVDLRMLVRSLLDAMGDLPIHETVVTLAGPPVEIPSNLTQPLIMVLLEWFTNSNKYGAHSRPGGTLRVSWEPMDFEGKAGVRLRWTECCEKPALETGNPSLGTELVKAFSARELRGRVMLRYQEWGADHVLEFPVRG